MLVSSIPTDALVRAQLTQRAAHEILRETASGREVRGAMKEIKKNEELGAIIKKLLLQQQMPQAQIPRTSEDSINLLL